MWSGRESRFHHARAREGQIWHEAGRPGALSRSAHDNGSQQSYLAGSLSWVEDFHDYSQGVRARRGPRLCSARGWSSEWQSCVHDKKRRSPWARENTRPLEYNRSL
eukprot:2587241-Pleurochrysis_carterae.AAC.3